MQRVASLVVLGCLLGSLAAGCGGVAGDVDGLGAGAEALGERTRVCLTVTRLLRAVESGSPDPARDAAAELLAQADGELREPVREVVAALSGAMDRHGRWVDDPTLRAAAVHLAEAAADRCSP